MGREEKEVDWAQEGGQDQWQPRMPNPNYIAGAGPE